MRVQGRAIAAASITGVVALGVGACSSGPRQLERDEASAALAFVPGVTTREQVLLRFGEPSASFENGRILTFRLRADDVNGFTVIAPQPGEDGNQGWGEVQFSLVVAIDERDAIREFNLIPVHVPVRE